MGRLRGKERKVESLNMQRRSRKKWMARRIMEEEDKEIRRGGKEGGREDEAGKMASFLRYKYITHQPLSV